MNMILSANRSCPTCHWYRPAASPCDILTSYFGVRASNKDVQNVIIKLADDEAKKRKIEAEEKMQQAHSFNQEWRHRPFVTAYCGAREADNIYIIYQLKNRAGRCSEYTPSGDARCDCKECTYRVIAPDPSHDCQNDRFDAAKAAEMEGIYYACGIYTKEPQFVDYCGRYSAAGSFYVGLIMNAAKHCRGWQQGLPQLGESAIQIKEVDKSCSWIGSDGLIEIDQYIYSTYGLEGDYKNVRVRIASWCAHPGDEKAFLLLLRDVCGYVVASLLQAGISGRINLMRDLQALVRSEHVPIQGGDRFLVALIRLLCDEPDSEKQIAEARAYLPPGMSRILSTIEEILSHQNAAWHERRNVRRAVIEWLKNKKDTCDFARVMVDICRAAVNVLVWNLSCDSRSTYLWGLSKRARSALAEDLILLRLEANQPLPVQGSAVVVEVLQTWLEQLYSDFSSHKVPALPPESWARIQANVPKPLMEALLVVWVALMVRTGSIQADQVPADAPVMDPEFTQTLHSLFLRGAAAAPNFAAPMNPR